MVTPDVRKIPEPPLEESELHEARKHSSAGLDNLVDMLKLLVLTIGKTIPILERFIVATCSQTEARTGTI